LPSSHCSPLPFFFSPTPKPIYSPLPGPIFFPSSIPHLRPLQRAPSAASHPAFNHGSSSFSPCFAIKRVFRGALVLCPLNCKAGPMRFFFSFRFTNGAKGSFDYGWFAQKKSPLFLPLTIQCAVLPRRPMALAESLRRQHQIIVLVIAYPKASPPPLLWSFLICRIFLISSFLLVLTFQWLENYNTFFYALS